MAHYIIGDIAGNAKTLMALIAQLPEPRQIVSVGDLVDRGPNSKEVIEYFMSHPEHTVLYGNHEDLMLNDRYTWLENGGQATLKSFGGEIPDNVKEWVINLPWSHVIEIDGKKFYISHAPVPNPDDPWYEEPQELWNRYPPLPNPEYELQIYGHNSRMEWHVDNSGGKQYAVCIDDCRNKVLTALELPSLKVYQQPYID